MKIVGERKLAAAVLGNLASDIGSLETAMEKGYVPKKKQQTATELHARDAVFCLFSSANEALNHWLQVTDMDISALRAGVKRLFPQATSYLLADLGL